MNQRKDVIIRNGNTKHGFEIFYSSLNCQKMMIICNIVISTSMVYILCVFSSINCFVSG